jgi:hypothetical protein
MIMHSPPGSAGIPSERGRPKRRQVVGVERDADRTQDGHDGADNDGALHPRVVAVDPCDRNSPKTGENWRIGVTTSRGDDRKAETKAWDTRTSTAEQGAA